MIIQRFAPTNELLDPAGTEGLRRFCRRMGWHTRQGEVALVIDDRFYSFTHFTEADA